MPIDFILREMTEEDRNFIFNSFLKSYYQNYPLKYVPATLYYKGQSEIVDWLLANARVLVACFPEDPGEIIGYVIFDHQAEALILHYIYVKNLSRRKYVASQIVKSLQNGSELVIATHYVDAFQKLKYKLEKCRLVYDPFLINRLREMSK